MKYFFYRLKHGFFSMLHERPLFLRQSVFFSETFSSGLDFISFESWPLLAVVRNLKPNHMEKMRSAVATDEPAPPNLNQLKPHSQEISPPDPLDKILVHLKTLAERMTGKLTCKPLLCCSEPS